MTGGKEKILLPDLKKKHDIRYSEFLHVFFKKNAEFSSSTVSIPL